MHVSGQDLSFDDIAQEDDIEGSALGCLIFFLAGQRSHGISEKSYSRKNWNFLTSSALDMFILFKHSHGPGHNL